MADKKQFTVEQLKDKISKLLRKAEGTDNVHEQQTFTEQAERMMLRLGITAAELEADGTAAPQDVVLETRDYGTIYGKPMIDFMFRVSRGYGNIEFVHEPLKGDWHRAHILGVKSDMEQFMALVDSLYLQVPAALKGWVKAEARGDLLYATPNEKWIAKRSFIEGYAVEVRNRLHAMRKEEEAEASPGAALVLVGKGARIEAFKQNTFSDLKNGRGNRSRDYGAREAGRRAGREANLGGGTSLPGGRQALG